MDFHRFPIPTLIGPHIRFRPNGTVRAGDFATVRVVQVDADRKRPVDAQAMARPSRGAVAFVQADAWRRK